jgi:DNA-binding Xre family transcriptional regulator
MHVHCRLREIMRERPITVEELHRITGVGREAICALRSPSWQRVSRHVIGKICGALNITLDQLFILNPQDIWASIKLSGEVTIHYGSRSLPEAPLAGGTPDEDAVTMAGQYIGTWDTRTFKWIFEYLKQTGLDVNVTLQEHVSDAERGFDPSAHDSARQIFESGNHVVIGSPVANQFTEEVVCHAYGVPPYAPQKREAFPYGFVWDSRRTVISSFGWQRIGSEFGIASTRTGRLVAWRTMVKEGEGKDCALILVYRNFVPPARRRPGGDKERVVICILGHSGAGTLAGAQVATNPKCTAGLYPPESGKPHLRVVGATYTRAPIGSLRDNRQVTDAFLVEDVEDHGKPTSNDPEPNSERRGPKKAAGPGTAKGKRPSRSARPARVQSAG